MDDKVMSFLREAVTRAVTPVGLFQATHSKLRIIAGDRQMWLTTECINEPPSMRHAQEGFWCHSNDACLISGSHGYTVNELKLSTGHLVDPVCEKLAREFHAAESVSVFVQFFPYPAGNTPAALVGNSSDGLFTEATASDFPGAV